MSLFDHLRPLGGPPDRPILECLTMLAAVASRTSRIRFAPLVLRAPLRPAGTVAGVFRTLDLLAPGRAICALGSGDRLNEAEDLSVGLPPLSPAARRAAVVEVAAAVRAAASGVPIWIGGTGRLVKQLAGERADGWNGWGLTPDALSAAALDVASAAAAAGRPAPRITWGGQVVLARTRGDAPVQQAGWGSGRSPAELAGVVSGDAAGVAAGLSRLVDAGARTMFLSFVGADAAWARRAFADDVLPLVRRTGAI